MKVTRFTLVAGIVFIVVGILGFIPGVTHAPHAMDPNIAVDASYGRLFGLFPVNVVHNLVHLALGLWAVVAARHVASAIRYCRISAVLYGALAILGLIPGLNTVFGLVPIFGHDVWLHVGLAAALAYYGFAPVTYGEGPTTTTTGSHRQATV